MNRSTREWETTDTAGVRADIAIVYGKPLDEWTPEELARVRPAGFPNRPGRRGGRPRSAWS
jgi:hypothetical protein